MNRTTKKTSVSKVRARTEPQPPIWVLKVKLVFGMYAKRPWEAVIEIDSSATLGELHFAIQSAVGFDDDHMYTFYAARTERSRERMMFETEDGKVAETTLAEVFPLPRGNKLFYWFDFGDDWKLSIARLRNAPEKVTGRRKYPRIVSTLGQKPVQYPEI
jgi:Plasmid pRiA4b ORF-3-like protein